MAAPMARSGVFDRVMGTVDRGTGRWRRPSGHASNPGVSVDLHVPVLQHAIERRADPGGLARQHLGRIREDLEAQTVRVTPGPPEPVAKTVVHREHHLDAARARSDHPDPHRAVGPEHALDQRIPARDEVADGLDRHPTAPSAPGTSCTRGAEPMSMDSTSVAHRGPVAADHQVLGGVESDDLVFVEARVGEARQGTEIDVDVVVGVVASDETGKHPRVPASPRPPQMTVIRTPGMGFIPKRLSTMTWLCPPPTSTRSLRTGVEPGVTTSPLDPLIALYLHR